MGKKSSKKPAGSLMSSKKLMTVAMIALMCSWVLISVIAMQFAIGMIMVSFLGKEGMSQPIWIAIYSALSYALAGALIVFVPAECLKRWRDHHSSKKAKKELEVLDLGTSRVELGLRGWPTWTDIGFSPLGLVVSLLLAAGLVMIFSLLPWFDAEQAQDVGFNAYISGFDRIIAFITLIVIAPIAEEIIFRGWLYGKIRKKLNKLPEWGSIIISTLIVSIVFGVMHGQWNVGLIVGIMSVIMCIQRELTGTIWSGILLHMIKNGMAFYLLFVR